LAILFLRRSPKTRRHDARIAAAGWNAEVRGTFVVERRAPTKRRDIEPRLAGGSAFKFRQTIRAVEAAGLAQSRAAN
jgi:hypothetical protein